MPATWQDHPRYNPQPRRYDPLDADALSHKLQALGGKFVEVEAKKPCTHMVQDSKLGGKFVEFDAKQPCTHTNSELPLCPGGKFEQHCRRMDYTAASAADHLCKRARIIWKKGILKIPATIIDLPVDES